MKKKIFTLLTLGVMLSFVCGTVNAQSPFVTISIDNTKYSNEDYWPATTDAADAAFWDGPAALNLYVGCEYTLTISLPSQFITALAGQPNPGKYIYIDYPVSIRTTLPDSIPLVAGENEYKIPFTITKMDSRTPSIVQKTYDHYEWFYWYMKMDESFDMKNYVYGPSNVYIGYNLQSWNTVAGVGDYWTIYPAYKFFTPPVYSFTHVTTYPDVWHIAVNLVSGNGANTLFSLDGGITWAKLGLNSSGVHEFSEWEIENMHNYVIFKEPNSCHWTNAYIFGEDYPEPPNPHSRLIIMNSFTNFTTSKVPGVHYVTSQRDFEFYVTANGDIPGTHLTVVVDPEKYPDNITVPIETEYLGNGTWFVSIKRVTTTLNIIDFLVTVGNEAIAGTSVWAEGGQVFINAVDAGSASIFSAAGALVQNVTFASGETAAVALPAGFYVAVINGKAFKFIIK